MTSGTNGIDDSRPPRSLAEHRRPTAVAGWLRTDSAHELSYRQAARLLAPWPRALEHPDTPDWVVAKTVHVGFIGGTDTVQRASSTPDVAPGPNDVVVLWGTGGGHLGHETVR